MRVKTYQASTMQEAMQAVRDELGDEAIIVTSWDNNGSGYSVTAAIEEPPIPHPSELETSIEPHPRDPAPEFHRDHPADPVQAIAQRLRSHGVPQGLIGRLCRVAADLKGDDDGLLLAGSLDAMFRFQPLPRPPLGQPFLLMGSPGSGKTISAAKIATRFVMDGHKVRLITTDTQRAGGIEQLAAFARILNVPLDTVENPDALHRALMVARSAEAVIIDTPGVNPFLADEADRLMAFARAADGIGLLVAGAGTDAMDAAEQAEAFSDLGASRMIATKLDLGRRLGGMLATADAGPLAFAAVSISHAVADPLMSINPMSLSRLLVAGADDVLNEPKNPADGGQTETEGTP